MHQSGFVNIIGKPNAGKSTLMNVLVGERMSAITHKPQTTRKRIIGIVNETHYQIVFSDTPGIIEKPSYKMQNAMNDYVFSAFEDADVLLLLITPDEVFDEQNPLIKRLKNTKIPALLLINKIDTVSPEKLTPIIENWTSQLNFKAVLQISALHKTNTNTIIPTILQYLPEGEPFYPKDQLTDRPERFFVSEIIREKILLLYHQEIPYSTEVIIESYKETTTNIGEPLVRIAAIIYVERQSQKPILLGKDGMLMKKLGTNARKDIEVFLESKVFLELFVKVKDNWRDDERQLKYFGYDN
ncbi:MAG: GTPase Era [Saprospiraceae bacterium]|nr:GTPase Era [Saprospiraceae bacterium]MBP7699644.1 GTPase Era [Saprospiraceae bacterium]